MKARRALTTRNGSYAALTPYRHLRTIGGYLWQGLVLLFVLVAALAAVVVVSVLFDP